MPRYFFHLRHGAGPGGLVPGLLALDPEGDDLPGPDEARAHALMVARDLINRVRLYAVGDWFTCTFEVTDEDGHRVATVPFPETVTEEDGG